MQAAFTNLLPQDSMRLKPGINILVSRLRGIQIYACAWLASLSPEPCAIKPASGLQAFFLGWDFWGVSLLVSHSQAAWELGTARAPTSICPYPSAPCLSCKG